MDFNLIELETIDSTNEYVKRVYQDQDFPFLVIAKHQEKGKGQREKSFYSPKNKGLYLSYVLEPKKLNQEDLELIKLDIAKIVSSYLNDTYRINTYVKAPNDIYYEEQKLAGVLLETSFNLKEKTYDLLIIGLGLNVLKANHIPEDIKHIYVSLEDIIGEKLGRKNLGLKIGNLISKYLKEHDYAK